MVDRIAITSEFMADIIDGSLPFCQRRDYACQMPLACGWQIGDHLITLFGKLLEWLIDRRGR